MYFLHLVATFAVNWFPSAQISVNQRQKLCFVFRSLAIMAIPPATPFRMLARQPGLKLLDLFFDFLFAFLGLKEGVVRVGALSFHCTLAVAPVVLVFLFIALQVAGELVIELRARQFYVDFMLAEVNAVEAQLFQTLQPGQGNVKAAIDEVKRPVEMVSYS